MGISDDLTCLLRNLYAGQEARVRTGHGTTGWFQIGKGVHQGCILSPCLFNFYADFSSVSQSCPALCDPMDCSMPGFSVLRNLLGFAQIHVDLVESVMPSNHLISVIPSLYCHLNLIDVLFNIIFFPL